MKPAFRTLAFLTLLFIAPPAVAQNVAVAGPHLSGDAYTTLRGNEAHAIIAFEVVTNSGTSTQLRNILLGPDYVIEATDDTVTLYDFRFHRLLTLNPGLRTFSNESLFGHVRTRFLFLQNNLTMAGMGVASGLTDESLAEGIRFANEHLNGIAHPAPVAALNLPAPEFVVVRDGSDLTGMLRDTPILTAALTGIAFPTRGHAQSFAAWLAWGGRIHPGVASLIADTGRLPAQISFTFPKALQAINPGIRQSQDIAFRTFETRTMRLDALRGWTAKLQAWPPYLPDGLAQIMVNAANGTAPGGPKTDEDYIAEIGALMRAGRNLDAVLLSLHATSPLNGCQGESRALPLCGVLGAALNQAREDSDVRKLFTGFALDSQREHRRAAEIWVRLRLQPLVRKDVLDFVIANALVEAQKKSPLTGEMATAFAQLPELFERALAADPYNPARYRDIYNYLFAAASSLADRYQVPTHAHAVIDLARALPDRAMPDIILQVVEHDQRLTRDFPVLFPTFDEIPSGQK